ncbi:hypothetical protein JM93_00932 [Roseibium hamelinense]|uniref:Uncharacterized protein n=1 Tax=Roseibium hamelinense TaxID=150831 RepID=A0A562TJS2_9HYPH|nr:hypothetical protein [Roseibium hamelinense]MTI42629.1 hypothetical protein [Roseibium hamelinense]TWI93376.1 hypothetical protein JM93_00932 [Roseibium hamelinense]
MNITVHEVSLKLASLRTDLDTRNARMSEARRIMEELKRRIARLEQAVAADTDGTMGHTCAGDASPGHTPAPNRDSRALLNPARSEAAPAGQHSQAAQTPPAVSSRLAGAHPGRKMFAGKPCRMRTAIPSQMLAAHAAGDMLSPGTRPVGTRAAGQTATGTHVSRGYPIDTCRERQEP